MLVVEPSAGLARQAAERPGLRLRQDDALAYALDPTEPPVERVLMKEVVHHLDLERLAELYQGLFAKLRPGGRLLTITRPVEPSYPLFEAAREVWRNNQPPVERFAEAQRAAGLQVSIEVERYPLELTPDAWFGMIRGRCWSTFSNFDDAALEAGIAEVARDHPEPLLRFADELLFVVADRSA